MPGAARTPLLGALGAHLKARRAAAGLTRTQLAERSGLSTRFLAQLEGGEGNISVTRLAAVAAALGVSAAELLTDVETRASAAASADERGPLVALVGLRGAGKSTIGERLALELGVRFFELDQWIERAAGLRLGQIFELHGEAYYRRLERETLLRF